MSQPANETQATPWGFTFARVCGAIAAGAGAAGILYYVDSADVPPGALTICAVLALTGVIILAAASAVWHITGVIDGRPVVYVQPNIERLAKESNALRHDFTDRFARLEWVVGQLRGAVDQLRDAERRAAEAYVAYLSGVGDAAQEPGLSLPVNGVANIEDVRLLKRIDEKIKHRRDEE